MIRVRWRACAALFAAAMMACDALAGGYVDGTQLLTQANSIQSTTTSAVVTFNNATLTDKNLIAEVNNNLVKTPSTS
ncbi:MAG: hypothetical protein KGK08_14660, partial [Acidobacteriota bacterium]|nr:hypothetical protein [Acidobacteriota bacterium]